MAIAGAVLTLLLYVAGFHEAPAKLTAARWIGGLGGVAIGAACLALAMREKRSLLPADADWGYGSAFGTGALTSLFGSLIGLVTTYAYFGLLNPGFGDVLFQAQVAEMEARGMPAAQIEKIEPMIKMWMSPAALTLTQGVMGFVFSLILALIVAIFFRQRPATPPAPPPAA
jgi:hypothetical protein